MHLPFHVVLASGSPRRRELLSKVVAQFTVEVSAVNEDEFTVEDPLTTAKRLAWAKAEAVSDDRVRRQEPAAIVIGGDTVVAVTDEGASIQLAKPVDSEDAVRMLKLLAGRRHAVITSLALISPYSSMLSSDTAWVTFRELTDGEIRAYVATGEPMDKAGAYAIQGGARSFVSNLEGDEETVIGLPTKLLRSMLSSVAPQ